MNDDNMASRLYGSTSGKPASEQSETQGDPMETRLYPAPTISEPRTNIPPEIAELRATDPERRLYDAAKSLEAALPDGSLGADMDTAEARNVAADLGAAVADLQQLRSLMNAEESAPGAWAAESEAMMKQERISAADIDGARQLVARDPRVREWLSLTGLGDHPTVVKRFVELARAARIAGRLPMKGRR